MGASRHIAVQADVAAPVEAVWRALRDPAEIRRWHGWEYDGLEAEVAQIFEVEAVADEESRTVETGGARFELEPRGAGTTLRLRMLAPPDDPVWKGAFGAIEQGWVTFVQQLRFALERHPGEDRRTVFVSGPAADEGPLAALGLAEVAALRPGRRYSARAATGDELAGTVWFRAERQLGLTVDAWGDGLLVVSGGPPPSTAMAVLSTYDLDESARGDLAERWSGWWPGE